MSYTEIKKLPVRYRRWYIDRIIADYEKQQQAIKQQSNQQELKRPDDAIEKMYRKFSKE